MTDTHQVMGIQRRQKGLASADDGMTLIEVIAAMVVFAISSLAILSMLGYSLATTRTNRDRVAATSLAAQIQDTMRDAIKNNVDVPEGQTTTTKTVGSTVFTVVTSVEFVGLGQSGDTCTGVLAGKVAYERITTKITWPTMAGTKPVRADAVVTPPAGALSANKITIPLKIVDGSLTGEAGILVTLTPAAGGTSVQQTTDDAGCVAFAQLTPGIYNAVLNVTGYVDKNGVQSHTENSLGQTAPGSVPPTTIQYAPAGSLSLLPAALPGFPMPNAFTYTVTQTGWTGTTRTYAGNPSTATVIGSLFPFTTASGGVYSANVGTCSDSGANPIGGLVTSGSVTNLAVPVVSTRITFNRTVNGNPVALTTGTVTVTTTSPCTNTYAWSTSNTSAGFPVSLPYGSLTFKVFDSVANKTYNSAAIPITTSTGATLTVPVA